MPGNGAAGASYGDLLVTSLLVLGAVCIAAYIAVRVFGRLIATGRARGSHLLDVVARVPLEPRRSLYVVEVAGKTLLVGTSEMGLSVLSELDGSEVKSRVQAQQSFGDLVRTAWQRRKALRRSADATVGHAASSSTEERTSAVGQGGSPPATDEPMIVGRAGSPPATDEPMTVGLAGSLPATDDRNSVARAASPPADERPTVGRTASPPATEKPTTVVQASTSSPAAGKSASEG